MKEGLSEDEALERYRRNKELNGTLTPAENLENLFEGVLPTRIQNVVVIMDV